MELQSRFGTDERFRMDSRFLEDEEEDDEVESGVTSYLYLLCAWAVMFSTELTLLELLIPINNGAVESTFSFLMTALK